MKKTFIFAALAAFAVAAAPVRAEVTPDDVKDSAHDAGTNIKNNTEQAGDKAENGARHTKNAGNRGAHKLRHKKDRAKADWKKNHPDAAQKADNAGDAAINAGERATDATK